MTVTVMDEVVNLYSIPIHKSQKRWRLLMLILTSIIFCVIIWQFYQLNYIKSLLVEERNLTNNFTAISVVGNGQVVRGNRDIPIHSWVIRFQYGDISFDHGTKINIKISGFYYIYVQMFFYRNGNMYLTANRNKSVMDFGVVNRRVNKRLIAATVSLTSCMVACTKHVSGIFRLEKGYILSVDTKTPGIYFKMVREKTLLEVYLLH